MRKTRRIVAEDDRVSNTRAPPFVLVRETEFKTIGRDHRRRLAEIKAADRAFPKAPWTTDRPWRCDGIWEYIPAACSIRWDGRQVLVKGERANDPVGVFGGNQLGRKNEPYSPALELISSENSDWVIRPFPF